MIDKLESAGLRARLAPFSEWIEFTTWWREKRIFDGRPRANDHVVDAWFSAAVERRILDRLYAEMAKPLAWGARTSTDDSIAAGELYVDRALESETILTVGGGLHEFLHGEIDGVVSVGPLECMPNKVAESHFQCVERDYGLPSLTLGLNGDPLDERVLDAFVYEVKERARRGRTMDPESLPHVRRSLRESIWRKSGGVAAGLIGMLPGRST